MRRIKRYAEDGTFVVASEEVLTLEEVEQEITNRQLRVRVMEREVAEINREIIEFQKLIGASYDGDR